jgi:glycosyltransferase XagB
VALVKDGDAFQERAHEALRSVALPAFPPRSGTLPELHAGPYHHIPIRIRRAVGACSELDCLRHRLPPATILAAETRAIEIGAGGDEVLIAFNRISPDDYALAFALSLGLEFETLDAMPRRFCPETDEELLFSNRGEFLPFMEGGELKWAIAPRGLNGRRVLAFLHAHPDQLHRVRITTPERIRTFVRRYTSRAIGEHSSDWMRLKQPLLSAATRCRSPWGLLLPVGALLVLATALAPAASLIALQVAFTLVFLAWAGLRIAGAIVPTQPKRMPLSAGDDALPVYTVIVALYAEAAAVPDLVEALRALNYPPEKLDIKLVLEHDDIPTRRAIERLKLSWPFEVIFAPAGGPRTKPKALNAALPFARGKFTVVYDAEDRPEPDQLRCALDIFLADAKEKIACAQARLTIDNTADSWLAGLFTAEYAGLFDVLLPSLATFQLPIPLGGSSNHFRTAVLRRVGAWDPYNVTEDADLGTRLSRLGYRTTVVASTTYEEAPAQLTPWLRQRTRWLKGWMRTWCVHMRQPMRLFRELGPAGFTTFQLMTFGTVLAALLQPIALAFDVLFLLRGKTLLGFGNPDVLEWLFWLHVGTFGLGYATSALLALTGLKRRGLLGAWWILLALPAMAAQWLLLSIAAWRALIELVRAPYRWDKTTHGLARTSRLARTAAIPAVRANLAG